MSTNASNDLHRKNFGAIKVDSITFNNANQTNVCSLNGAENSYYTGTITLGTPTPAVQADTGNIYWTKIGNRVTIQLDEELEGDSYVGNTVMTLASLPASRLYPLADVYFPIQVTTGGSAAIGMLKISSAGVMTVSSGASATATFDSTTDTDDKVSPFSVSYLTLNQ